MGWLSKLFSKPEPVPKPTCSHDWQELSWYLETDDNPIYAGASVDFCYYHRLVATYICTKCGHTSEKILSSGHTESVYAHEGQLIQIKTYAEDRLQPKFMVEAEIARIRSKI